MKIVNGQYITGAYNMDIVIPIDLTGSMSPCINTVTGMATRLVDLLGERMADAGKSLDRVRVQVIGFRDYNCDGEKAIVESPVFELPQDNEAFKAFLNAQEAMGGGDAPESGLEALALAARAHQRMHLPDTNRHLTIFFTDNVPHPLHDPECVKNPLYPADMPKDISELTACLCCTNQGPYTMPDKRSGRLVLFAPDAEPWSSLATIPHSWLVSSDLDKGLGEHDENNICDICAHSVMA